MCVARPSQRLISDAEQHWLIAIESLIWETRLVLTNTANQLLRVVDKLE